MIQSGIDKLTANRNNDPDGMIGLNIAAQSDLLLFADMLLDFCKAPDPQKAQELRKIAMSSSMKVLGLIKIVMDKMDDPYKFSPPAGKHGK